MSRPVRLVVEALYAYRAADENQINLNPGDIITVIEKDPSGWWIGTPANGEPGIFPATYVKELNPEDAERAGVPAVSQRVRSLIQPANEVSSRRQTNLGERLGLNNEEAGSDSESENDEEGSGKMTTFLLQSRINRLEQANQTLENRVATQRTSLADLERELSDNSQVISTLRQQQAAHLEEIRRLKLQVLDLGGAEMESPTLEDVVGPLLLRAASDDAARALRAAERRAAAAEEEARGQTARCVFLTEELDAARRGVVTEKPADANVAGEPKAPTTAAVKAEEGAKDEDSENELRRLRGKYAKLEAAYREQRKRVKALEAEAGGAPAAAAAVTSPGAVPAAVAGAGSPPALPQQMSPEAYHAMKSRLEEQRHVSEQRIDQLEKEASQRDSELAEMSAKLRKYKRYAEKQLAKEKGSKEESAALKAQLKAIHEEEIKTFEGRLREKDDVISQIQRDLDHIKRHSGEAIEEAGRLRAEVKQLNTELVEVRKRYEKEERLRRKIYNELQELRGNIRVFCRVRAPLTAEERASICVGRDPASEGRVRTLDEAGRPRHGWEFDQVFDSEARQEDVFEGVKPLALSVLDGFNISVFAYGQTGSGKTFTMVGPPNNRGVNYRTVAEIFNQIACRASDYATEVAVSCTEIYNEEVHDLLNAREVLDVKVQTIRDRAKVVTGAIERAVSSADEVIGLMEAAFATRATASHDVNAHSSRSHCLLTLHCKTTDRTTGQTIVGKIHLVDLAGSERQRKTGASGDRLKEAAAINKSLFELGNTIRALAKKEKANFRNSKLTLMLADSLGGNCKCLMFANCSPHREHIEETEITMRFAANAKDVELGKAGVNRA